MLVPFQSVLLASYYDLFCTREGKLSDRCHLKQLHCRIIVEILLLSFLEKLINLLLGERSS
jgi:hypothetical protein